MSASFSFSCIFFPFWELVAGKRCSAESIHILFPPQVRFGFQAREQLTLLLAHLQLQHTDTKGGSRPCVEEHAKAEQSIRSGGSATMRAFTACSLADNNRISQNGTPFNGPSTPDYTADHPRQCDRGVSISFPTFSVSQTPLTSNRVRTPVFFVSDEVTNVAAASATASQSYAFLGPQAQRLQWLQWLKPHRLGSLIEGPWAADKPTDAGMNRKRFTHGLGPLKAILMCETGDFCQSIDAETVYTKLPLLGRADT